MGPGREGVLVDPEAESDDGGLPQPRPDQALAVEGHAEFLTGAVLCSGIQLDRSLGQWQVNKHASKQPIYAWTLGTSVAVMSTLLQDSCERRHSAARCHIMLYSPSVVDHPTDFVPDLLCATITF